jgi:anti-sigma factor RsiW
MSRWWHRRRRAPLSCQELVELVTDYAEGVLSTPDRARFEGHLAGCPDCARYVEQLTRTVALAAAAERPALSQDTQDALLDAFRDWHSGR